jgi:hypothetical protein
MNKKRTCVIVTPNPRSRDDKACVEWLEDIIESNFNSKCGVLTIEVWTMEQFETCLIGPLERITPIDVIVMLGKGPQELYDKVISSGINHHRIPLLRSVHGILDYSQSDWKFKQQRGDFESRLGCSVRQIK